VTGPSGVERVRSLRWRLLGAVFAAVLLIWLLTGWFSYHKAQHEAEELMDGNLAQTGHLLLAIMQDNDAQLQDLAQRLATVRGTPQNIYEPPLEFQLGRSDGTVLARSLDAPMLPILGVEGYSDIIRHDQSWRVLNIVSTDGRYRVQVSHSMDLRDLAALEVAEQTVLPLAIISPLLLLLIYASVRRALRPLDRLAAEVAARTPENLQPLSARYVPSEARPLVDAISRLFERVRGTLDNERRFTADASHELRTPLAAIKVQTQVALRSTDPAMRDAALQNIESGVDRAGHLVEELLRLARLDPMEKVTSEAVDLRALIMDVTTAVRDSNPSLAGHNLVLPESEIVVTGDAELLRVALRNLVDNALRYSDTGDPVEVDIHFEAGRDGVTVTVADRGPGVPDDMLGKIRERFYRGRAQDAQGSGLGLAITARIVELHDARLELANRPEGGFVARIIGLQLASADDVQGGRHKTARTRK